MRFLRFLGFILKLVYLGLVFVGEPRLALEFLEGCVGLLQILVAQLLGFVEFVVLALRNPIFRQRLVEFSFKLCVVDSPVLVLLQKL